MALDALVDAGHDLRLVVTRPDKRRGRGAALVPTPVKAAAVGHGLPVTSDISELTGTGAELGIVVAYGRIIRPEILAVLPMVNVHFSLLPRWRGAAPVERAILAGDAVTGVCLMDVEEGLDTGAVYRRRETPVDPEETAGGLTGRLARMGAEMLVRALDEGLGRPVPQEGEATYAAKIEPGDLLLQWERPAEELQRVVRLERAWTTWSGHRLRVLRSAPVETGVPAGTIAGSLHGDVVATGRGGLRLLVVQPEGKRPMPASDWLRGSRIDALGT